jgi:hypothetical protein
VEQDAIVTGTAGREDSSSVASAISIVELKATRHVTMMLQIRRLFRLPRPRPITTSQTAEAAATGAKMTVTAKRVALILVANAASMLGHKCISVVTSRMILYRHHLCRRLITISQTEGAAATDARRIVTVETVVSILAENAASTRGHKCTNVATNRTTTTVVAGVT